MRRIVLALGVCLALSAGSAEAGCGARCGVGGGPLRRAIGFGCRATWRVATFPLRRIRGECGRQREALEEQLGSDKIPITRGIA